jgi:hypothetical protein
MANTSVARGPFGIAQITAKSVSMRAIGTLAPAEPEVTKIYRTRAERCLLQARAARSDGRLDVMQQLFDAAKFWVSHAEAIEMALNGGAR